MTEDERDKQTGRFLSGNSGGGRKKGARNKLGEQFLDDLYSLWQSDGDAVLREARTNDPVQFAKMVAGLLPRELLVRHEPLDDLTDDELIDIIGALRGLVEERKPSEGSRPH